MARRGTNRVGGYEYSRYQFSNRSLDIQEIFRSACARVGVECKNNNEWLIAVSTRAAVARMDLFVGSKY